MSAQLRIMQRTDSDGAIRVALIGELDLASADAVGACLAGLLGEEGSRANTAPSEPRRRSIVAQGGPVTALRP